MTIRKIILLMSSVPLVLSILLIGFIVAQMIGIQQSSSNDVQLLLKGKELNGDIITTKQTLANYATNPSELNKEEALIQIEEINKSIEALEGEVQTEEQSAWLASTKEKYQNIRSEATQSFTVMDTTEIKRQAARTSGILNDVHMFNLSAQNWYDAKMAQQRNHIERLVLITSIASLVLIVLSVLSSWRLSIRTAVPLRELATKANQVANGDLTVEITQTKKESKNEIVQLSHAFQHMVHNLKDTIYSIETMGKEVHQFSTELSQEMNVLTESTRQVASSTDEMAQGSQSISSDVQEATTTIDDMHASFQTNLEDSKQSHSQSNLALQSVEEGQRSMQQQRSILDKSTASTKSISTSVHHFVEYTDEIENTAQLVNNIAEQTNLLALNAAIEAARAGEHGKGFAVVAEEVRKLADQSRNATEQIFEMVQQIKTGISSIEDVTQQSLAHSHDQEESMEETEAAFASIKDNVTSIFGQLEQLVDGVETSNQMSQHVAASMQNISAVTEETAAGTEEISASSEEQLNSFQKVEAQVHSLQGMIDSLDEKLNQFKLNN
ncbi:methyl-accepting chemotaxis protein [Pontibacillus salicampi]|uniref:Methyl-accepting chemotaxis protein n=1 Tax=Pontibacillus salicampi TaxID=1449801 RepID=A0ABV6LMT5_9BACI